MLLRKFTENMAVYKHHALVLCYVFVIVGNVLGTGKISLRLDRYTNPGGKGENGNCCDGIGFICRGECDHYFKFCFDNIDGSAEDISSCPLGTFTTDITREQNSITFGETIGSHANPIEFDITSWPGSTLLKIVVNDDDTNNDNDLVENLSTSITVTSSLYDSAHHYSETVVSGRTRFDLAIAVICDETWFGSGCDVQCNPHNRSHYNCTPQGSKLCHTGWTGEECGENIDECASSPCATPGGLCKDLINGFECLCKSGYTGQLCELDINECESQPCLNDGKCEDMVNAFQCLCPPGYSGHICDEDIDECLSDPCVNQGRCNHGIDSFTCSCLSGFAGVHCEMRTEPGACKSSPCEGDSTCTDVVDSYTCMCPSYRSGDNCEVMLPHICDDKPCYNGGTCERRSQGYRCRCARGWTGINCDRKQANQATTTAHHLALITLLVFFVIFH